MTTLLRRRDPWTVQPGWGIHVDLTPQELISTRQVRVLRKLVLSVLVAVVLIVAAAWFSAAQQRSAAEDDLNRQLAASTDFTRRAAQPEFTSVTAIQGALQQTNAQIGTLMKADVQVDALARHLSTALPQGASYSNVAITIAGVGANAQAAATTPSVTPDGTHQRVGNVSLGGTARSVDDVSLLVERLQKVAGFIDVVPTSSTKQDNGVHFQISVGLDDRVLSHRFDVKAGN